MNDNLASGGIEIDPVTVEHPTLKFLHDYWNEIRGTRAMPARRDVRPSDMKDHLRWVAMVDVLHGGKDFRYRLLGTMVTRYFNWDPTGKTVSEAFSTQPAVLSDAVMSVYRFVVERRRPLRAYGNFGWAGKGMEECEALHLPLSDDGETVDVVLHGFVFDKAKVLLNRDLAKANNGVAIDIPPGM